MIEPSDTRNIREAVEALAIDEDISERSAPHLVARGVPSYPMQLAALMYLAVFFRSCTIILFIYRSDPTYRTIFEALVAVLLLLCALALAAKRLHVAKWLCVAAMIGKLITSLMFAAEHALYHYEMVHYQLGVLSKSLVRGSFVTPLVEIGLVAVLAAYVAYLYKKSLRREGRYCQACDYNLYGIQSTVCPECGTPIETRTSESTTGSIGQI